MRRDLVVLIALAFALAFPSSGLPQSATSALVSKSPRVDLKALMAKANSGNPKAQFELGVAYVRGFGVDKSEYEAMRWYRLAANSGHTEAQNSLAYLYETGPDGLKDLGEAVKWYRRGAIYGNAMAQFNLGRLYLYGRGVQQSNDEALHWMQKSVDGNCPLALAALSVERRHIIPAGIRCGIGRIGWHTFRHTFRTLLDETGAPMKVQQELMRHADIRTTMNVCGKAMDERRAAYGKVVSLVLPSHAA